MASWNLLTQPSSITSSSIATDSIGKYVFVCTNQPTNTNNGVYISSSYGSNWVKTTALTNIGWTYVSSDSTGKYLAVCSSSAVYSSSSYGTFWNNVSPGPTTCSWSYLSISENGTVLSVAGGGVSSLYVSTNSGTNWTHRSPDGSGYNAYSTDSTGRYIITNSYNNTTYVSNDFGVTWKTYNSVTYTWAGIGGTSVKVNSMGDIMQVAGYGKNVALSTNYGNSFTTITASPPTPDTLCLTGDSTGKFLTLGSQTQGIKNSTNFGYSWSNTLANTGSYIWNNYIVSNLNGTNLYGIGGGNVQGYVSYIAPPTPTITLSATQNINFSIAVNTATVAAKSNSAGALAYYLSTSFGTTSSIATITNTFNTNVNTSIIGGSLWVGVGGAVNTLAYSNDGITWTGLGKSIFSNYGYGVAWNGTRWIAVGDGTNTIAYSSNGTTWTGLGSTIFTGIGYGVAWNGIRWVALGSGTHSIAYSNDGLIWTGLGSTIFTSQGWGAAWNGTRWVALGAGTNTIAYSDNGTTWTGLGTSIFSDRAMMAAWNGTRWVAVGKGTNHSLAYSSDGITWTGLGLSIFQSWGGYGVAWNGTRWVAGGFGTNTLAYSNDGLIWTGLGATIFTSEVNGVAYNRTRWVALGAGTNTIAYSNDGLIWTGANNIIGTYGKIAAWNADNATINTGTVEIRGIGTINVYITQSAYGTSFGAITTPTLAGTINVLAVPTIRPANAQTVSYPATTSATVTASSTSPGALTYSLQFGFPIGTTINSTTGVVTIGGTGTINVLAIQDASGNFAAVTTPVAAGSINVLGAPTITPAATQTIAYRQVNKVTVNATSTSPGALTYSLQTNTANFSGFATIDPSTGVVTLGGIGTINVFVTQAATNVYSAITTPVSAGTITVNYVAIPCFKEDTQILTIDGYRLIQDLRKGDLVKTLNNGYVPINTIGHQSIYNEKDKMIFDKIFKCSNENYPEIFEDLYITGLHAVLVDELTEEQQSNIKGIYNDSVYITDDKYRLPVCYDERSTLYETETTEKISIFHLALDHENENLNYGIYANGLLVETTSIQLMKESGLIMVE